MTPLQQQFEVLKQAYPDAELRPLPSGAALVTVPHFPLGTGWSQSTTAVKFVAPVGYPLSRPDCFWASPELRLEGGRMPNATNLTSIPETGEMNLWFSWHAGQWNPNRDNLLTYLWVIRQRLRQVQ